MVARWFSAPKVARSNRVSVVSFCFFVFPPFLSTPLLFLGSIYTFTPKYLKFLCIRFDFPTNFNLLSSRPTKAFNA